MPQCTIASSHTQLPPTPREEQQRKWDERKLAESLDAQESTNSETDMYTQESKKEKEEISPPHPKKCKKKAKVVKSKEYKIWWPKKRAVIKRCSLCSEKFSSQKDSMITLQDITSTSFYVVIESVARLSGVQNPLKSIDSAMEK